MYYKGMMYILLYIGEFPSLSLSLYQFHGTFGGLYLRGIRTYIAYTRACIRLLIFKRILSKFGGNILQTLRS
jgi:hypothetical protein